MNNTFKVRAEEFERKFQIGEDFVFFVGKELFDHIDECKKKAKLLRKRGMIARVIKIRKTFARNLNEKYLLMIPKEDKNLNML